MAKHPLWRKVKRCFKIAQEIEKGTSLESYLSRLEEVRWSRRQFLENSGKLLAAGAVLSSGMATSISALAKNKKINIDSPVVILGAGLAGLTAAYTLQERKIPFVIVEASQRLGGRVLTKKNFNTSGMFVELGAELVDSNHSVLLSFAKNFGLKLDYFPDFDKGMEAALYYSQGRLYSEVQFIEAILPLAKKIKEDQARIFGSVGVQSITYKNRYHSQPFDEMSVEKYLEKSGIENWARECIRTAFAGELGLDIQHQSALNLIFLFDTEPKKDGFSLFGESDEAYRIRGGNSSIVEKFEEELKGEKILFGTKLQGLSWDGKKYVMRLEGAQKEIKATHVICTIPFSVFREVEGVLDMPFTPQVKTAIQELRYGLNSKYMMGFTRRFWREQKGTRPAFTGSCFTDQKLLAFWESSRSQKGLPGILTNFLCDEFGKNISQAGKGEILDTLQKVFREESLPFDGQEALMNWPKYAFAKGSYACFGPGQYGRFAGALGEAQNKQTWFFAGEHISVNSQGFMNGAMETGQLAARRLLA